MAITASMCKSYLKELMQGGVHAIGDTYKIALYTSAATLSKDTAAYSATNEVAGTGYTAGGVALANPTIVEDLDAKILDFDDPSWASATITARAALIYNSSKANKAVAVLDFGVDIISTNGTFLVQLPAATAAAGVVRLAPA